MDSFGTIIVSDNDDDGQQQTRICYVMPGGNYGYHARQDHPLERGTARNRTENSAHLLRGADRHLLLRRHTAAEEVLGPAAAHRRRPARSACYHLTTDGAGYDVKREDMVTSTDNWFRPSDICVAPDGSAYIADWYDPGVGGHGIGDFTRGRIYRLAPKGNKPNSPKWISKVRKD